MNRSHAAHFLWKTPKHVLEIQIKLFTPVGKRPFLAADALYRRVVPPSTHSRAFPHIIFLIYPFPRKRIPPGEVTAASSSLRPQPRKKKAKEGTHIRRFTRREREGERGEQTGSVWRRGNASSNIHRSFSLLSANRSSCSRTDTTSRGPSSAVPPPPTKQASTSQVGREGRGEREAKHLLSLFLSPLPMPPKREEGIPPPLFAASDQRASPLPPFLLRRHLLPTQHLPFPPITFSYKLLDEETKGARVLHKRPKA